MGKRPHAAERSARTRLRHRRSDLVRYSGVHEGFAGGNFAGGGRYARELPHLLLGSDPAGYPQGPDPVASYPDQLPYQGGYPVHAQRLCRCTRQAGARRL